MTPPESAFAKRGLKRERGTECALINTRPIAFTTEVVVNLVFVGREGALARIRVSEPPESPLSGGLEFWFWVS